MQDRLIVALDVPTIAEARALVAELDGIVSIFKIGMWLFFQPGTDALIDELVAAGKRVFLDYKMYDIGETVRRGVASAAARGISFVTVHGDRAIIEAAVAGRGSSALKILAVTVLTSLDDAALTEMGYRMGMDELIVHRTRIAAECGCDGIIASAHDNPNQLREAAGAPKLLVVTPGVRMAGAQQDDHRRSADPTTAIANGADYLVVGRPVVQASDRAGAARDVIAEMEKGRKKQFFFEKKNQKTFAILPASPRPLVLQARAFAEQYGDAMQANKIKVFCFFSSEKKALP